MICSVRRKDQRDMEACTHARIMVKPQSALSSRSVPLQSDGKQSASYLEGQAAYAASGGFSDAHHQQFSLQPQHQQQGWVFRSCPFCYIRKMSRSSGAPTHRQLNEFRYENGVWSDMCSMHIFLCPVQLQRRAITA